MLPSLSVTTFMPGIFFFLSRFSMSVTSVPFGPAAVQHRHCMYDSSRLILSHRLVPPSLLFFLSRAAHTYCLACTYIVWVFLRTFLSLTSFSNRGLSPHRTPVCLSPSTTVLDFASSAYVLPDPSTLDRAHDVRPTGASAKRVGLFYVLVLNICLSMAWAYNQSLFVSILSYKLHLVPYPCLQSQVHVLIVNECLMHVMVVL